MESTEEDSNTILIPPRPEIDKRTTSTNDGVDYDNLNDLLLHVRHTLCSDALGNLSIKGSNTTKDRHHQHLQDVVKLTQLLEEVKALMERDMSAGAADSGVEGKGGWKFTSSQQAAIRNIVYQAQRKQAATESESLKARVKVVERMLDGGPTKSLSHDIRSLKADVQSQGRVQGSLEENTKQLRGRADQAEQQLELHETRIKLLEDEAQIIEDETEADGCGAQMEDSAIHEAEEEAPAPEAVTSGSLPTRKEVAIICDGPFVKTGNQLSELSEQQIQRRKRHLDTVIQHARALAALVQEDQELNLPKQNKVSIEWEEQDGSTEAIAAAQQLWRVMKAGDCVRVERAEDCPRITYWFAQPIARAKLEGDYGIQAA